MYFNFAFSVILLRDYIRLICYHGVLLCLANGPVFVLYHLIGICDL